MIHRHWYTCIVAFLLYAFTHTVMAQQKVLSIYFIGDAGEPSLPENGLKSSILAHYDSSVRASFVFLGDNIYPKGLPPKNDPDRELADFMLKAQVDLATAFSGMAYFVPGNHDWHRDGKHGWERIILQQQWIDSLKNPLVRFLPKGGCPGPVAVTLGTDVVMIVIDSQWFLHPWDKPRGEDSPCEMKQPEDVALQLQELLERHKGKRIIVAAHHPIFTYGEHGGSFTLKDHLFPLTAFDSSNLYIPMPIIGSVYPLYRKLIGSRQDVAHPLNKQYRNLIRNVLEQHTGIVYANGHEHTLQYSVKDSIHYVTSGSSVKVRHVRKKGYAQFVSAQLGYVRMDVFGDGTAALLYFEVLKEKPVFQVSLKAPEQQVASADEVIPPTGHFVKVHASDRYTRKRTSRWLGENYRMEWKQDLDVPVFDLSGWKIVQKGGGMQTLSLRLEDSVGNQFTLRSVEKYP
ncbi:MAG TPA: metallophosphoesterase, partial [Ohtaekwangia sp.]|nr:metallophosphoesterase [Ohtaekwangia sp.]